ncbi:MAG: 50S ribosomal protein L10 [Candidatus Omnitrophica bacterium]|nr:50S ribosomal protein L10 [Candidatus Omnitrophota bacterium]
MKKLGAIFRETLESRIKENLKSSSNVFIINYAKLSSPDMSQLRQALKGTRASLFVAKNTVAKRALKESGYESLVGLLEGPCGLVFIPDEPVVTSKALCDFTKDHENLKLAGGCMGEKVLAAADIQAMAKLPSKEVLRTQVVIGLKSPITGLVMVLKGNLRKLVFCLEQIKQKKNDKA